MARGRSIRDLFVRIGFDADDAPLQRIDRGVTRLKGNLRLLKIGLVGAFGTTGASGLLLNLAGQFEQTELSFEVMLRSAKDASVLLKDLYNFAKTTPFEIRDVLGAAKQLKAYGFEVKELIPTMTRLGNVAAGVTRPGERLSDTFNRIAINFGQVRTQTRLLGNDARQFAIAGIPIYDEIAKVMGVTTKEVRGLGEKGQISFGIVEQAFMNMSSSSGQFFNLMDRQSKTFLGIMSNIKDVIVLVAADLGKTLLPQAKKLLKTFLDFLEASRGTILTKGKRFFIELGSGILFVLKIAKDFGSTLLSLTQIFGGLENTIKLATAAMFIMFSISMLSGIGNIAIGLFTVATAFTTIGNAAAIAQIKAFGFPLLVGVALFALGLIVQDIIGYFQGLDSVTGLVLDTFEEKFPNAFNMTKTALKSLKEDFSKFIDEILKIDMPIALGIINLALETMKTRIVAVGNAIDTLKTKISDLIPGLPGYITGLFKTPKEFELLKKAGFRGAFTALGLPSILTRGLAPATTSVGAISPEAFNNYVTHVDIGGITLHGVDLSESEKIKDVVVDAVKTGMLAPAHRSLRPSEIQ